MIIALADKLVGDLQGIAYLLIMAGLVLGTVNALRFVTGADSARWTVGVLQPVTVRSVLWSALPSVYWPPALIWLGFLIGASTSFLFQFGAALLLLGCVSLSIVLLRRVTGVGKDVAGAACAILVTAATLLTFGALFIARLTVGRTKEVFDTGADLFGDSLPGSVRAVLGPIGAVGIALLLLAGVLHVIRSSWFGTATARLGARRSRPPEWLMPGLGVIVVFALFVVPYAGDKHLDFLSVQTQEFGKIVYLCVLALLLVRFSYRFRVYDGRWNRFSTVGASRSWPARIAETARAQAHVLWLLVLFGAVAAADGIRGDIGPILPMFLATAVVIIYAVRVESGQSLTVTGHSGRDADRAAIRNFGRYARPFVLLAGLFGAMAVLLAVVLGATGNMAERFEIADDIWRYPWTVECVPADAGIVVPADLPEGAEVCLQPYTAVRASEKSQVAKAVSVIDDAGLWGRGLSDITSRQVSAGDNDFILALIWSKLGALVVVALAALVVLLAFALARLPLVLSTGPRANLPGAVTFAPMYAAGVAALLVAQFLVQLAMTVGAIPHSGLTIPFLSVGAQSSAALGIAVVIVVVAAYRERDPAAGATAAPDRAPSALRPQLPSAAIVFAVCLALVVGIIITPYQGLPETRALCGPGDVERGTGLVRSARCSTDLLAHGTARFRITVDGVDQFEAIDGAAGPIRPDGLTIADLGGVLLPDVLAGTVTQVGHQERAGGLRARLMPPTDRDATTVLDLSLDGALQRAVAAATEHDGPGTAAPLPAGVAVLDARTGRALALAGAPVRTADRSVPPEQTWEERSEFDTAVRRRNESVGDWRVGDVVAKPGQCAERTPAEPECVRWQVRRQAATAPTRPIDQLRRFVAGDPSVRVPRDDLNRFSGGATGVGSVFKVVVAAAYLRQAGTTADDPLPAPETYLIGNQTIRNYGGGLCRTTVDGRITLTNALAVSCNTAFVALAERLRWETIRDTAVDFGFRVGADSSGAWLTGGPMGEASSVPASGDPLGNTALGGGEVVATPLQIASMLATVANDGLAVQPSLVTRVRSGDGNSVLWTSAPQTRRVLDAAAAAQLSRALSATTSPGGTAAMLRTPDGRPLWVKTGTHEIYTPGEVAAPGEFARQSAWVAGFVSTPGGPVSFAVRVETREEAAGSERARWLAQQAVDAIVRVRG